MIQTPLEKLIGLDQINAMYHRIRQATRQGGHFLENALKDLNVTYDITPEDYERIPAHGPVVVVSNHPFGGIEGIILLTLLRTVRPDVMALANYLLGRMPEMDDYMLYVNPFESRQAARQNITGVKQTLQWVRDGHMLITFPSGTVSHYHIRKRTVMDPEWNPTIARIIRKTHAAVLPIYFQGHNGPLFQVAGLLHPRLRTALLVRQLLNKRNSVFGISIGSLIPFKRLDKFENDEEMRDYLRFRTYHLFNRLYDKQKRRRWLPVPQTKQMREIAPPVATETIAREVESLSADHVMLSSEDCCVYLARAPEIPNAMQEIGRLREITFRAEGEGTGQPSDLDHYDRYYMHLFLWDKKNKRIAGAYRIARTEEVLEQYGKKGLYTSSLFRYRTRLLRQLGPALELGRSFILPEYQRAYTSLMMLWKGIGQVILLDPRYKSMFGPVSINNDYHSMSRQMMVSFLKINRFEPDLARLIKARKPMRIKPMKNWDWKTFSMSVIDIEEISDLITEIEKDQKGVPVLLRQYLKLGGKLLAFNIDPDFSNVLDGLVWVDLLETDPRIVNRFMGKENARRFYDFHDNLQ